MKNKPTAIEKESVKWVANLVLVTFEGRKKVKEEIIKENLSSEDLRFVEAVMQL